LAEDKSAAKPPDIFKPGDNLVIEGIPDIPQDLVNQVERYTNFRSASITDWHPKERYMLINTRFAETTQVHELKLPMGVRTQLTFFNDAATGGTYQPTDSKYMIFSKDKGGDEFYQKYRYDFQSKNVSLVTDGTSRNTGGVWSKGGNLIAYGSTRRTGNDVDIYVVDPSDPKSDHMVAQLEGGGWDVLDWSKDDKTLLALEELSINDSNLWSIDVATGAKKLLTPKAKVAAKEPEKEPVQDKDKPEDKETSKGKDKDQDKDKGQDKGQDKDKSSDKDKVQDKDKSSDKDKVQDKDKSSDKDKVQDKTPKGKGKNKGKDKDADKAQEKSTKEKPKNQEVVYTNGRFSKDGKSLYMITDKDSEFRRLAIMELDSGETKILTPDTKWDVTEFELSWDGHTIAYRVNDDGRSVLHLFDTISDTELPAPKVSAGQVSGLQWHRNNHELGFVMHSAKTPGDIYSYDLKTQRPDRWTRSETGNINTSSYTEPELIHWKSFDGKMISGFLYKPPARFTGKRPVVINIHGGPESQSKLGFIGKNNYFLNELGVAIIYPNVRGSSGYGKTFLKLDNGVQRADSYKDIAALIDSIHSRFDLDADRIMVTGGSYGGHMTLAVAAFYSDKIRCAVDVVGPSNLVTFLENTQGYRRDLRRVEYGDERDKETREVLEKIAPSNNADKIKKPLFVIQGKNDPRVPASESIQMVAAVRKAGTPVWFLMANDEGHGFAKKKNNDFQFYATVLFMQKYLLN